MKTRFTIKRIIALFLLGVFTLGITPKKTLHRWLANHTDNSRKSGDGKFRQLSKGGFNCQVNDLVVESGFIAGESIVTASPIVFCPCFTPLQSTFFSLPLLSNNLRGPPVKG